jgi:hypothetical protein
VDRTPRATKSTTFKLYLLTMRELKECAILEANAVELKKNYSKWCEKKDKGRQIAFIPRAFMILT